MGVCTANLSVDSHGCLLLHGVGDMAVDVERSLRADVSYHGGESLDIHAIFKCHRSEGVAQVVKADLLTPRSLQYLLEFSVDRVGIPRLSFLDGGWEHPLAGGGFLMLRKDFQHIRGQKDGADGGFGLGLTDLSLRPLLDYLPFDVQLACGEVDVLPLKPEYLPAAHTRGQLEEEELVVSFLVCLDQKPSDLVLCQHLHLLCFLWGQSATDGRVDGYQALGHRLFEGGSAGGVAGAHHAVGQALPEVLHPAPSAALLQPCVELLQVVLRELVHRNLADLGDDVVIDSVLVALLRCLSDFGLGEVLIPEVHPIAKRHIRLEPVAGSAPFLFESLELFLTFSLRFSGYVFGLRIAVFIITDNDSSFPSTVLHHNYTGVTINSLPIYVGKAARFLNITRFLCFFVVIERK